MTPSLKYIYAHKLSQNNGDEATSLLIPTMNGSLVPLPSHLQLEALSALGEFATINHRTLVELILVRNSHKATALHGACTYGEHTIVDWICGLPMSSRERRELFLALTKNKWLALHNALRSGHVEAARSFVRALAKEIQ